MDFKTLRQAQNGIESEGELQLPKLLNAMEEKCRTFDEAFEIAIESAPEELECVPIDPFVEDAFNAFEAMQKCVELIEDCGSMSAAAEQD